MATLGSVMNSALKSMAANQLALSVASNNIANAETPDYTRQRLVVTPSGPGGDAMMIGAGVDVVRVEVLRDQLVETRLRQETSSKSGGETLTRMLGDMEVLFNDTGDVGLLQKMTNFFNSFHTLSQDPVSMNFREELKINTRALIDAFRGRYQDLANFQTLADKGIAADVDQINQLTQQIADVSAEIRIQETEHTANDLRDRRGALVKQLSQIVEVHELDSGREYQLSTKDNRLLVLNRTTQKLAVSDVTANIGNGSMKAKLDIRDQYIPKYTAGLDKLAYELTQQVNAVHSAAYDLDGRKGIKFFTPLTSSSGASRLIDLSTDVSSSTRSIAASSLSTGTDNGAARAMGNLLHSQVFTGGSITDQYRTLVFGLGSDLANAEVSLKEHEALVHQLQNRRQSISGVSMDEETVQILQFQRAYEASARLVRTVDELLQVALGLGA